MFDFLNFSKKKNILKYIDCFYDEEKAKSYYDSDEKLFDLYHNTEVKNFPLALHYACLFKREKFIEKIIDNGNINQLDSNGYNCLHYLSYWDIFSLKYKNTKHRELMVTNGFLWMAEAFGGQEKSYDEMNGFWQWGDDKDLINIAKKLIDKGVDINKQSDSWRQTPLMTALRCGFWSNPIINSDGNDFVRFLISQGAKTDVWSCLEGDFESLLFYVNVFQSNIIYGEDRFEIFKFLYEHGAPIELDDELEVDNLGTKGFQFNLDLLDNYYTLPDEHSLADKEWFEKNDKKIVEFILANCRKNKHNEKYFNLI